VADFIHRFPSGYGLDELFHISIHFKWSSQHSPKQNKSWTHCLWTYKTYSMFDSE